MAIEVVLDVYSGLQNPSWIMQGPDLGRLRQRLADLRPVERLAVVSRPGLGYRGIRIDESEPGSEERWQGPYHVFGGVVVSPSAVFGDDNRSLERWLLDRASAHFPELLEDINLE